MGRWGRSLGWVGALAWSAWATASPPALQGRVLEEADYADRLRAMWLGEIIANWTGIRTEGQRPTAPFFTDADIPAWAPLVLTQDPWLADDDTDIESAYLAMMYEFAPPGEVLTRLSPDQIAQGWVSHVNRYIWVSNASARALIARGVTPPATSFSVANNNRLMIDAQLTTEFFGAMCPGMPERAMEMAQLPIRTTASGHAADASRFYIALYALALQTDPALPMRERILSMVTRARAYLPDTSKAAGIVDLVLADYLANPDVNDWERTRDLVYDRYQLHAGANGFMFRAWYESSVNLAGGLIALLYGEGNYERTVQIGALSGWDSDNGTATMGGLLGLMKGYQPLVDEIRAAHPGFTPSDRFDINRTRDNMPDYLPGDPLAQDTFALMAGRMIPIARREILDAGGRVDGGRGVWHLPRAQPASLLASPDWRTWLRSATRQVRAGGGVASASCSTPQGSPAGTGTNIAGAMCDGLELDARRLEQADWLQPFTTHDIVPPVGTEIVLSVTYDRPVTLHAVRFIEGDHFDLPQRQGGWFTTMTYEVLTPGGWVAPPGALSEAQDQTKPYQKMDWELSVPMTGWGVRVRGLPGGWSRFVTCAELDGVTGPVSAPVVGYDLNGDGVADVEDLYEWSAGPVDLSGDGVADGVDRAVLARWLRWRERDELMGGC